MRGNRVGSLAETHGRCIPWRKDDFLFSGNVSLLNRVPVGRTSPAFSRQRGWGCSCSVVTEKCRLPRPEVVGQHAPAHAGMGHSGRPSSEHSSLPIAFS